MILTKTLKALPKLLFSLSKLKPKEPFMKTKNILISVSNHSKISNLKFMKYLFYGLLAVLIFTGCAKKVTTLLGSWTMENLEPKQYEKLAVLVFSPNVNSRGNVELALADEFEKAGVKAMSTFSLFTMASNMAEIKAAGITDEQIEEAMKKKIADNNIDALLIVSVLNTKKHERFVQGGGVSVGVGVGGMGFANPYYNAMAYPAYNYPYYGYYSYTVASTSSPGYYETTTDAFVESNLYDIASEKLIWTAQTNSKEITSVEKEAPKFAKIIVDDIIKKKALLRK
jgi:hypothetical protein